MTHNYFLTNTTNITFLDTLRDKEFVGDFIVTIYHNWMGEVKINGYKPNSATFPYGFSCKLQSKVNEICFKIASGVIDDENFTFDIKGQVEYLYTYGVEE